MNLPITVVREHRIAQLNSSSRVVSYMYCILGTVWGSELVCLCEVNVRQFVVCTACLCCVVLCCVMRECYRVACCIFSCLSAVQ